MLFQFLFAASLAATTLAAPFREPYTLHEKRDTLVRPRQTQRVDANAVIPVRIALKQRNLEHAYSYIKDVSHPASSNYGRHWTLDEVNSKFAPSEDSVRAVREWLSSVGIDDGDVVTTSNKGWLAVDLPVWRAEELFKTTYYEHESASDGSVRLGCDEYHLPERVSAHVDYLRPGVALSPPLRKRTLSRPPKTHRKRSPLTPRFANNTCDPAAVTPACLRSLYNIPQATDSDDSNALGIYENSGDVYDQHDLDKFFQKYAPQVPTGTHPTYIGIDNAPVPSASTAPVGGESNVDFSIGYSLIYPQQIVLYQVEESDYESTSDYTFMNNFLEAVDGSFCTDEDSSNGIMCGGVGLTKVVSISYGAPELEYAESAAQRTCNEFMKLSLQGTTFVVSSGDQGVASSPVTDSGNGCVERDNVNATAVTGDVFNPSFPVSCPYVLAVGATMLTSNSSAESVMLLPEDNQGQTTFTSGGGFANYASLPDYQNDAVSTYLDNYVPDYPYYTYTDSSSISGSDGLYNRAGRGIPDVSANGANFQIFVTGDAVSESGTSLSAPIWASMLTLINEERTKQGKGSVGFVNTVLYENTGIFTDITSGNNPGCGTDGFPAAPGWDPSTGLGTPDYPTMLDVFLNLQ